MPRISFYSTTDQPPLLLLPSEIPDDGSIIDPFGQKAEERTLYYKDLTFEIAAGKRPVVGNQNKGGKWFSAQLRTLFAGGNLMEEPGAYIQPPDYMRITTYHP